MQFFSVFYCTLHAIINAHSQQLDKKNLKQCLRFFRIWWRDPGSNWGHTDFQSVALPTELSRRCRVLNSLSVFQSSRFYAFLNKRLFLQQIPSYLLIFYLKLNSLFNPVLFSGIKKTAQWLLFYHLCKLKFFPDAPGNDEWRHTPVQKL